MALTAVATLALGIGANTALFTVIGSVLLRPLNYPHSEAIVEVTRSWPGSINSPALAAPKFDFWHSENHSFEAMAAHNYLPVWTALELTFDPADTVNNFSVIARLKSGVSLEQAKADMRVVDQRLRKRFETCLFYTSPSPRDS